MRRYVTAISTAVVMAAAGVAAGVVKYRRDERLRIASSRDDAFGTVHSPSRSIRSSDGLRLHVEIDEGPAPTLVFLHGWMCTLDTWHYQRLALRGRARMVFEDLRSHGESGRAPAEACSLDDLASDLEQILEQLVPDSKIVLVGHSMGAMTIMRYAERNPAEIGSRIVGAVLVGTSAGRLMRKLPVARQMRGWINMVSPFLDLGRVPGTAAVMRGTGTWRRASQRAVDEASSMIAETRSHVIADFVDNFIDLDLTTGLNELARIPVSVVTGREDKMTPTSHSRWIARQIGTAQLVTIPEAGHMVMLERPEEVTAAIDILVQEVTEGQVP
jgi:pimeloyl-ACP methyl ester carboxylesterase